MDTKEEILKTILPCPFCGNLARITMGGGWDEWDGTTKAEYPTYSIRCSSPMGSTDPDAILCSVQPCTGYMHWTVEAAKEEWNTRSSTALITDAISLLHALCSDRGVILHATCVPDPRTALHDLLIKHNLLIPTEPTGWTDSNVKVTVHKEDEDN